MNIIAIIGATASGKSSLSLELAYKNNAIILSLDSLSVYKELDIASAKPSNEELAMIKHFGINEVYLDKPFNVMDFARLYDEALDYAKSNSKDLIIVGGSSFYLKSLIDGLSIAPKISEEAHGKCIQIMKDREKAFSFLKSIDESITIHPNDTYRIEKYLDMYFQTGYSMKQFHINNPKTPIIQEKIQIFELYVEKQELDDRIKLRTNLMLDMGLLDEIKDLISKYDKSLKPLQSIGVKESISHLNNEITLQECKELIIKNTKALSKRQKTFNKMGFNSQRISDISQIKL